MKSQTQTHNMINPAVQKVVGFLIAGSSLMMLPPVLVSYWYNDGTAWLFLLSAGILLLSGLLITIGDVITYRIVEQDGLLCDHGNLIS